MNRFFATFVGALSSALITGAAPGAWAQDATTNPNTQTPAPSQSDTSSPLTPTNPSTSTPLTQSQPNPVSGQNQQSAATVQSSSEVPTTFVQPPIEGNRVDAAAPSSLQLVIDPSSGSSLLNPDATQLSPTAAGVSLNSVQGTTSTALPSPLGGSLGSSSSASPYPTAVAEPASTQAFLTALQGKSATASSGSSTTSRGSSTSMGPLIGSAAVQNSSTIASMTSTPTAVGSSTFMKSPGAINSPITSTSASLPAAFRTLSQSNSSFSHHSKSSSHH
jgi:hypothetical protein